MVDELDEFDKVEVECRELDEDDDLLDVVVDEWVGDNGIVDGIEHRE